MQQILTNYVGNAIKFTTKGTIGILVGLKRIPQFTNSRSERTPGAGLVRKTRRSCSLHSQCSANTKAWTRMEPAWASESASKSPRAWEVKLQSSDFLTWAAPLASRSSVRYQANSRLRRYASEIIRLRFRRSCHRSSKKLWEILGRTGRSTRNQWNKFMPTSSVFDYSLRKISYSG